MQLSADMREVWKRLAANGMVLHHTPIDEYRWHPAMNDFWFLRDASAMQGCKL